MQEVNSSNLFMSTNLLFKIKNNILTYLLKLIVFKEKKRGVRNIMFLFFQKSKTIPQVKIDAGLGSVITINSVHENNEATFNDIYVSSNKEAKRYKDYLEKNYSDNITMFEVDNSNLKKIENMPYLIGKTTNDIFRSDLDLVDVAESVFQEKKIVKIGIFNSSENAFGDLLIFNSVFLDLEKQLKEKGIEFELIIYNSNKSKQTESISNNIISVNREYYPLPLSDLFEIDILLENMEYLNSDFIDTNDLHEVIASQICLKLSEDFSVSGNYKTQSFIKSKAKKLLRSRFQNKLPIITFNKNSTTILRKMPKEVAEKLLLSILDSNKLNIVTFDSVFDSLNISHKNFFNFGRYTGDFRHYINYLSETDGVISVDSAPIHLAARLNIPSFGIYTTIPPKLREKFYPKATSIFLENKFKYKHNLEILSDNEKDLLKDQSNDEIIDEIWKDFEIEETAKQIIKKFKKGFFQ